MTRVYEPAVRAVPPELRRKLEPPEIFHEILEHRWYMAERVGHDVPIRDAIAGYLRDVLPSKPDEQSVLGTDSRMLPVTDEENP